MGSGASQEMADMRAIRAIYEAHKSLPDEQLLEMMRSLLHSKIKDPGTELAFDTDKALNEFLLACGKFQKGGSKTNLSRAQSLLLMPAASPQRVGVAASAGP